MKLKTSELSGKALNYAVAKSEGYKIKKNPKWKHPNNAGGGFKGDGWYICTNEAFPYQQIPDYSTKWEQGGPIIDREEIAISRYFNTERTWKASISQHLMFGPTPLIAAMRCYVKSILGEYVDIPEELL